MLNVRKALVLSTVVVAVAGAGASPVSAANGRNAAAAAVGAAGGFALGAAAAQPHTYYPGPNGYTVYERGPVDTTEDCRLIRRRVWVEGAGWRVKTVESCD